MNGQPMQPTPHNPDALERARAFIDTNQKLFREQLLELLRIPSVSTDSRRLDAMAQCANLVRQRVADAGLDAEIIETDRHPIVYGERRGTAAGTTGGPTLLVYGHYDVQPAEMEDGWSHPPFEPVVENGNVIARGASDDKGQSLALLAGVHAALESGVGPDVTIKFLIEGEEECGSASLLPFVRSQKERLKADAVVIADCSQLDRGIPAITCGLRGIASLELVVRGPKKDLHSGIYGGAVTNPANVLTRIVNACQAPFGKIGIPGFYDQVRELSDEERAEIAALPFDADGFLGEAGSPQFFGEEGYSTLERRWVRPTFDVNGLVSGHTGEGGKTVLPREARAKISMRLVPDQDPDEISALTTEFLLSLVPSSVEAEVIPGPGHGAKPFVADRSLPTFNAAAAAVEIGFGRPPVFIREGGSIPVVNTFKEELGIDSVLIGFGLPDDGAHGPNEKFSLTDFQRGMMTMAALMDQVSRK